MPKPEAKKFNSKERWAIVMIPAFLILAAGIWLGNEYVVGFITLTEPVPVGVIGEKPVVPDEKVASETVIPDAIAAEPEIQRTKLPEEVRGIYWTATTAGGKRGQELLEYMKDTGLNTVVIDLKMDNGQLAFNSNNPEFKTYTMKNPVLYELDELLRSLHQQGIYRIARIAVMRDNAFAENNPEVALKWPGGSIWQDNIGSNWVDPASKEVADYAIAIGQEAYERGFDEIQYDYVRFASDGQISSIRYPVYDWKKTKVEVMQNFFEHVGGTLQQENIPVSFDLFGMTFEESDDYNIGQRLIDAWPYADFISPMVYPSHYPNNFVGFSNPALYPYEIVSRAMDRGANMLETELKIPQIQSRRTFRPWIQDFDIGAVYTSDLIEAQIKAARDTGTSGFLIWNARNVYEPANYLP